MFLKNKTIKYSYKNQINPNKLLGQHFLRDKNVLRQIIAAANLTKNDIVLEIGPGLGVLTREIAKHAGHIIAVEKDRELAKSLTEQLTEEKIDNVEVIEGDILKFPISNFLRSHRESLTESGQFPNKSQITNFKNTNYKVVANIPYYLTSHLIRFLLESDNPPQDMILMIQKEVAKRICAKPPAMSLLAASVQFYAAPKIIAAVPKKSFWPAPKVDSAIIKITPHSRRYPRHPSVIPAKAGIQAPIEQFNNLNPGFRLKAGMTKTEIENFFKIVKAGFSHPRKQLMNNLSKGLKIEKEKIIDALQTAGIKPQQRAETLNLNNWLNLTKILLP